MVRGSLYNVYHKLRPLKVNFVLLYAAESARVCLLVIVFPPAYRTIFHCRMPASLPLCLPVNHQPACQPACMYVHSPAACLSSCPSPACLPVHLLSAFPFAFSSAFLLPACLSTCLLHLPACACPSTYLPFHLLPACRPVSLFHRQSLRNAFQKNFVHFFMRYGFHF